MGKRLVRNVLAAWLWVGLPAMLAAQDKIAPAALAVRIDQRLAEKWQGVVPAAAADDAEFLRRVYLDIAGRIPRVSEIRDFLDNTTTERREQIVEQLLDSPQYVKHFSTTWRNLLLPANNNPQLALLSGGFKPWLEQQVRDNIPYDEMVRDLLTASLANAGPVQTAVRGLPPPGPSPVAFFLANEQKPENLAASTSRIFMGVKLECAQCHDHPFARWSRDQFWEMAAFFTSVQMAPRLAPGQKVPFVQPSRLRQIKIPGIDKVVAAKFLTGAAPVWNNDSEPRTVLADWLTAPANPYFASTAVNRIWAHFFGVGLIDPVDDEPTEENPVSHPELLAELSNQFVAHNYDIKYLIRAITATQAYQRTSRQNHVSQAEPRAFARMAIRGLTPEQLFDSIALATGYREPPATTNPRLLAFGNPATPRGEFLSKFASQERATEKQTSILQALALMNGKFVGDATTVQRSTFLAAIADAPFLSLEQKIESLYLATLSRLPKAHESERLLAYVNAGGPRTDVRLGDVLWALLNSSEFILNH